MNSKISELDLVSVVDQNDVLPIVNGGITKKVKVSQLSEIRPYKVYTALLTQSGGDNSLGLWGNGDGDLTSAAQGTTVLITANPNNTDYSFIGAPNSNEGTYFVLTQDISYTDLDVDTIFDINLGAPVVTILENTIGNVWFSYSGVGQYLLYSNNAFITGKTWNTKCLDFGINGSTLRALLNNNEDLNTMNLFTESDYDIVADGILYNTPIEIRVYN